MTDQSKPPEGYRIFDMGNYGKALVWDRLLTREEIKMLASGEEGLQQSLRRSRVMRYWEWLGIVLVVVVPLLIVSVVIWAVVFDHKRRVACEELCDPVHHKIIDGGCYCATASGYDRAKKTNP